jgi:bifunctional N-acetylglucosamine-1-phosphate-uridyltransferase/glucosamine-1-phosphate-acetyltransferase GlmU-like protein
MENEAITAYRQRRRHLRQRLSGTWLRVVVFYSADGILIDDTVEIAPGAVILPGTILRGETKIGAGSVIGPNSLLENVTVGENVKFNASQVMTASSRAARPSARLPTFGRTAVCAKMCTSAILWRSRIPLWARAPAFRT